MDNIPVKYYDTASLVAAFVARCGSWQVVNVALSPQLVQLDCCIGLQSKVLRQHKVCFLVLIRMHYVHLKGASAYQHELLLKWEN